MVLQLSRYQAGESGQIKNDKTIPISPGEKVGLPFFETSHALITKMLQYQVVLVVCHIGHALTSGHYITAVSVRGSLMQASAQWKFLLSDDGKPPKRFSSSDFNIDPNGYLIGLAKSS